MKKSSMKPITSMLIALGAFASVGCATHPDNLKAVDTQTMPVFTNCHDMAVQYNELDAKRVELYHELKADYEFDKAMIASSIIILPVFIPSGNDDAKIAEYVKVKTNAKNLLTVIKENCKI